MFQLITKLIVAGIQTVYNSGFVIPYLVNKALWLKHPFWMHVKRVNLTNIILFVVQELMCEDNLWNMQHILVPILESKLRLIISIVISNCEGGFSLYWDRLIFILLFNSWNDRMYFGIFTNQIKHKLR